MGKISKIVYTCDFCDFETEGRGLLKECGYCGNDFCKECGELYLISICKEGETIYSNSLNLCEKCGGDKEAKDYLLSVGSRTIGQVNVKFSD